MCPAMKTAALLLANEANSSEESLELSHVAGVFQSCVSEVSLWGTTSIFSISATNLKSYVKNGSSCHSAM